MGFLGGIKALAQKIGLVKKAKEVEEAAEEGGRSLARAFPPFRAPARPGIRPAVLRAAGSARRPEAGEAHADLGACAHPCRNRRQRPRAPPGYQGPQVYLHQRGLLVQRGECLYPSERRPRLRHTRAPLHVCKCAAEIRLAPRPDVHEYLRALTSASSAPLPASPGSASERRKPELVTPSRLKVMHALQGRQPDNNPRLQLEGANAQMLEAAFNQTLGKYLKCDPEKTVSAADGRKKPVSGVRCNAHCNDSRSLQCAQ
jgi:hypothetical protein